MARIKLDPDGKRMAVLLPLNMTVEVWDVAEVVRLQSHPVPVDAYFMVWQNNLLLTVAHFSGAIQVVDTNQECELGTLSNNHQQIDAVAMHRQLCATGQGKSCKLWSLNRPCRLLASFVATKTHLTALSMNDAILVSGSVSGIVKIWDLQVSVPYECPTPFPPTKVKFSPWQSLLRKGGCPSSVKPLRRISMKGVMHYPIKLINQFDYLDLVIVAKYESKAKKDKIKLVQIKSP